MLQPIQCTARVKVIQSAKLKINQYQSSVQLGLKVIQYRARKFCKIQHSEIGSGTVYHTSNYYSDDYCYYEYFINSLSATVGTVETVLAELLKIQCCSRELIVSQLRVQLRRLKVIIRFLNSPYQHYREFTYIYRLEKILLEFTSSQLGLSHPVVLNPDRKGLVSRNTKIQPDLTKVRSPIRFKNASDVSYSKYFMRPDLTLFLSSSCVFTSQQPLMVHYITITQLEQYLIVNSNFQTEIT